MPKPNTTIVLDEPVVGHEAARQLVFREPRWGDLVEIGPAYRWAGSGEDAMRIPDYEALGQYAERCLVEPADPLSILPQLSLADGMKVRNHFLDAFLTADVAAVASRTSQPISSSGSAGAPPTSQDSA